MKKILLTRIIILLFCFPAFSQKKNKCCSEAEDSLKYYGKAMLAAQNPLQNDKAAARFRELFFETLNCENAFSYPFDSLKMISKILSPDKKFRLLNWQYRRKDGKHCYYCFIQLKNPKTKKVDLIELTDNSSEIDGPESRQLNAENWYGALYYQMVPVKVNGKKYYTLLGMKWNNSLSSKKVIDVLWFNDQNQPVFGESIFKYGMLPVRRIVFEFSTQASMMLRYEKKKKYIIWEHLAPTHSHLSGSFQFYGPDGSYDALKFDDGKWNYIPDANVPQTKPQKRDTSKVIRKKQPDMPYMKKNK
ncbi:MAG: hypothetical protein V2A54_00030 [Bacteroidota bacterium]